MNRPQFQTSVCNAWDKVMHIEYGETFSNGGSLDVDEESRDLVLNDETKYEDIFLFGLKKSHYNFLLSDHSYFQFTWNAEDDVRYAFYPNPYIGASAQHLIKYKGRQELFAAELVSYEDYLQLISDSRGQGRIPVLRYENAPSQYKALIHPCSHFHIGLHGEDRWAVRRLLSPLAFTMIVLRNYYSLNWQKHGEQNIETGLNVLDEQFIAERQQCRILEDFYFSDAETRAFYIA